MNFGKSLGNFLGPGMNAIGGAMQSEAGNLFGATPLGQGVNALNGAAQNVQNFFKQPNPYQNLKSPINPGNLYTNQAYSYGQPTGKTTPTQHPTSSIPSGFQQATSNVQNAMGNMGKSIMNLPGQISNQFQIGNVLNAKPQAIAPMANIQGAKQPTLSPIQLHTTPAQQPQGYQQWLKANGLPASQSNLQTYTRAINAPGGHPYGVTPTPIQQQLPSPTSGTSFANPNISPNITIPTKNGPMTLPSSLAQNLMNYFNATGQATHSAQVLVHPEDQTYTQPETLPKSAQNPGGIGHPSINYGENASFKTSYPTTNPDGTVDRGLFRINSGTFAGYMSNPQSQAILAQHGITKFEDMDDPQKNAMFASLLQSNRGWEPWYAAPLALRTGQYSGPQAVNSFNPSTTNFSR